MELLCHGTNIAKKKQDSKSYKYEYYRMLCTLVVLIIEAQ